MEVRNRFVALKNWIDGTPSESDFELKESVLKLAVKENSKEVIVKNLYLSMDPYQLNRMKSFDSSSHTVTKFSSALTFDQVIDGFGVGRVEESDDARFKKGDKVVGQLGWEEYSVIKNASLLTKIESTEFPLSYHVGILGTSGFTAYAGFYEVCKPKQGEKVFVSAACGSVGSVVGQYAKLLGCYVVGCAGSNEKVDLLRNRLGFDDAFNYKEESNLELTLKRYFPQGIDIYFDNVGGKTLEAAIANMNTFGRVAVCGAISQYTNSANKGATIPNVVDVIFKRITIRGFLLVDYWNLREDFLSFTCEQLRRNRMHVIEDISKGLESLPSAFVGLFHGSNVGKKIVQLGE